LQTETNLLDVGSGLLAGGADAAEEFANTLLDLNHNNATANSILKLAQTASNTAAMRMQHNTSQQTVSTEELKARYKQASRLTSNVIFGSGDGTLGPYARDEAIRRRQARIDKVNAGMQKKKLDLSKSLEAYLKLKLEPNYGNPDFKWTVPKLKIAIKVKKLPGDKALPSSKEALLDRYNKTKRRPTPQPSPATSDDEASSDEDSDMEDNDGDSHVGLVFGDDDSSSETSDDELEDESEDVDNE